VILFQKDDAKYRAWAEHLQLHGIVTAAIHGSPIGAPFQLLRHALKGRRVRWYVFRYLNDYPSWAKTFLRLLSEVSVLVLMRLLGGQIAWVAHNVDRESSRHHCRLMAMRRRLVSRSSSVIFVTDPLLVPRARQQWPWPRTVSWVCFGQPVAGSRNRDTEEVKIALRELRSRLQRLGNGRQVYVGLCVSSPEPKCRHFLTVCDFVERYTDARVAVGVVVVGDVGRLTGPEFVDAVERLRAHPGVLLIDRPTTVYEEHLAADVNFLYRVMSDVSVPMTVYVAAAMGKPLITEPGTFLEEMVSTYGLGLVTGAAASQEVAVGAFWQGLEKWDQSAAKRFLELRNWSVAADQFARAFHRPQARPALSDHSRFES
jgi:hypothetical protein